MMSVFRLHLLTGKDHHVTRVRISRRYLAVVVMGVGGGETGHPLEIRGNI